MPTVLHSLPVSKVLLFIFSEIEHSRYRIMELANSRAICLTHRHLFVHSLNFNFSMIA
uniref:Uncharacterized protein n=1 Tax=Octopus bimaculoides TaxID=37653 RepID=A0A0L8I041_OCTBM